MKTISGFTFVHNAIDGGYPIVEAILSVAPFVAEIVIIECESTDNTAEILARLAQNLPSMGLDAELRIVKGYWGQEAGETLKKAYSMYKPHCKGDIILHFEADEVWDIELLIWATEKIESGLTDLAVFRLQLEQNFQRCRWYPETVHRVWARNSNTIKMGHTSNRHYEATELGPEYGYLWDITNCFRDNWLARVKQQADLRKETEPQYLLAPLHALHKVLRNKAEVDMLLQERHWEAKATPFQIPAILRPLVGKTKYAPKI